MRIFLALHEPRCVAMPQPRVQRALAEGQADFALGCFADLESAELVWRKIGQHGFVCICSADHPALRQDFSLRAYCEACHVIGIDLIATVLDAIVVTFAERHRPARLPLPSRSPVFEAHTQWSKGASHDPAHRWLRTLMDDASTPR